MNNGKKTKTVPSVCLVQLPVVVQCNTNSSTSSSTVAQQSKKTDSQKPELSTIEHCDSHQIVGRPLSCDK